MLDVSRIKALCFDVDGTLRDTDDQYVGRVERVLRPFRFLLPGRQVRPIARAVVMGLETPGNLAYHLLDHLDLDDNLERVLIYFNRRQKHRALPVYWVVPGVEEALLALKQRFPLAVISARDQSGTLGFLKARSLLPLFETVVTSQTTRFTKPFPEPVFWAARELGVQPQNCLMIGDTTVDIRAGRNAGAQTVGVLCGFGHEAELRRAGADLILPSPAFLPELLLKG